MLKRCLFALLVTSCSSNCSSNSGPIQRDVAPTVRSVTEFHTQIAAARDPVPAWTLTAADGSGLRLASVEAKAVIEGPLAYTELHLRFHNPEQRVREGTFAITLPARAAISRFAMQEGDTFKEAEVVPKALARRAYDDFLHRRIDPALLEKAPGNQFTARVFPIPANGEKHLVIAYSQELANDGYLLPLRGLPLISKVSIELRTVGGATQTLDETQWQPDRDFVSNLSTVAAVRDGALVAGAFDVVQTFSEVAQSQGEVATDRPKSITLLVDTSASRALGFERYLANMRGLVDALAKRYAGLELRVIAFDQTTQAIYAGPANGFGDAQLAVLRARGPGGASDLARAASLASGRTVILTDGVVTAGVEGVELVKAFAKAERVDIVLAGGIREERVAQSLTRAGKRAGDVFDLDREGIAPIASGLGETIRVDVPVEVANATWFYPKTIASVRNGSQVMVYAKLKTPATPFEVTIGRLRWTATVAQATPALLQRAAARAEIEELEATLAATPASQTKTATQLRSAIETKSVAARVISSQTTMLVLDTEADYATYGIDRKSLADVLLVGPNGLEQGRPSRPTRSSSRMALDEGAAGKPGSDRGEGQYKIRGNESDPQLARQQAIEAARNAGMLGATRVNVSGFASGTSDISSGFDARDSYGGLVGTPTRNSDRYGGGAGRGSIRARVAAAPAVTIAQPVVSGSLDKTIIKRYIKRRINQISYCYERELLGKPTLEGTLQTQFVIAPGGKVTSAMAMGVDEAVAKCVKDVIKTIEFPTVTETVQVSYPFHFRLSGATHDESTVVTPPAPPAPPAPVAAAPIVEPPPPPPEPVLPIGDNPTDALTGKLQTVMQLLARKNTVDALATAMAWRDTQPGDVLAWVALGEALEARGDRVAAARAYGSIIDLFGARAEYRRFAGERLERTGERTLAIDTYRRAVTDRPDQLTGYRLLAYAQLRNGDHAGAFATMLKGVDQNAPSDRYLGAPKLFARDAGMIASAYIVAHIERGPEIMAALKKRSLSLVTESSTRFILYWETDANDVDLHVRDKTGAEAFFSQRTLDTGGELFADVTTGFGPECFEINGKLPAAPYELGLHYYAQGPMGYGMGLLQIQRFDGRAFTFEDRPFVIMQDDARISLGKVR